jgi:hypothetical protein
MRRPSERGRRRRARQESRSPSHNKDFHSIDSSHISDSPFAISASGAGIARPAGRIAKAWLKPRTRRAVLRRLARGGSSTSTTPPDTAKEAAPTMEKMSYMAHPRPHPHRSKVGSRLAMSLAEEVEQPRAANF